jgi:hypothetical protein
MQKIKSYDVVGEPWFKDVKIVPIEKIERDNKRKALRNKIYKIKKTDEEH